MKKLISFLLTIILIGGNFGVIANAADDIPYISTYEELYELVMKNSKTLTKKYAFEMSADVEIMQTLEKISNEPLIPWVELSASMECYLDENENILPEDSYIYRFNIRYRDDYVILRALEDSRYLSKLTRREKELFDKAKKIIAEIITDDMTEFDKALAVYTYIIKNARYDGRVKTQNNDTLPISLWLAEGVLLRGIGVCSSYSAAFNLLCGMLGIESMIVLGVANTEHAWNKAKLDGNWYNFDLTWGDPTTTDPNFICYYYFGLTDEAISKTHKWDETLYPEAESTEYHYFTVYPEAEPCCRKH